MRAALVGGACACTPIAAPAPGVAHDTPAAPVLEAARHGSPGLGPAADRTIHSPYGEALFAASLANAGDIDGDGVDDLAVGAEGAEVHTGAVGIYNGATSGGGILPTTTLVGPERYDYFGAGLSPAGDVNADGFGDLAVAAPEYEDLDGIVWVYLGAPAGLDPTNATALAAPAVEGLFGYGLAGVGDCDGDGFDDVAVGSFYAERGVGRVDVFSASSGGAVGTPGATLPGMARSYFGGSVSHAGDTDGDGFPEILVGARVYEDVGWAGLFPCAAGGPATTPSWETWGPEGFTNYGVSTSTAGDVNGDGYSDIVVSSNDSVTVWVYTGGPTGPATTATTVLTSAGSEQFGFEVAGGGDLDADGYDDIAVGDFEYDGSTGMVQVFYGGAAGIRSSPDEILVGPLSDGEFGYALTVGGDYDADGFDDLVVGAPGWLSAVGFAAVYRGEARDLDGDGRAADVDCDDDDPSRYPGATEICDGIDQDCDGVVDNHALDGADWFADLDADGYGDPRSRVRSCEPPPGHVTDATDCNDRIADVHPGAVERCDPSDLDQDCDGRADDADPDVDPSSFGTWFPDTDADGYGDTERPVRACTPPAGTTAWPGDCDDTNPAVGPQAHEVCNNGLDDDCDPGTNDACPDTGRDTATGTDTANETGRLDTAAGDTHGPGASGSDGGKTDAGCGCESPGGLPPTAPILALVAAAALHRSRRPPPPTR